MNELDLMVVVEVPGRSLAVGEESWRLCKPSLGRVRHRRAAVFKAELEGVYCGSRARGTLPYFWC